MSILVQPVARDVDQMRSNSFCHCQKVSGCCHRSDLQGLSEVSCLQGMQITCSLNNMTLFTALLGRKKCPDWTE